MRIKVIFFTIAILSSSAFAWEHPLKMSFNKLTVNVDGTAKLEARIFLDDLSIHMQDLYGLPQTDFSSITTEETQALSRYLKDRVYFEQGGERLDLWINTVSRSKNELALVVNMSTTSPLDTSKEVFFINTVLCDASPTQVNDTKYLNKHYLLNESNPKMKILFD